MRYLDARIIYVDTSRLVCDAISIDGMTWIEDILYSNSGLKDSGDLYNIEIGDVIVVEIGEDGQSKLFKHYEGRKYNQDGLLESVVGIGGYLPKNKMLPGDRCITGPDGAFLNLLRGGFAAVGSSPLAQTIYLAIEGLVRTVAQNYEMISSGSRIYSINDAGKITTRACFNTTDICFSKGAKENKLLESENFEYQIDFTEDGLTIFVGDIDESTNKRNNNLVITLKRSGDINLICGKNIIFDIYSNGSCSFKMIDENQNIVYNKTVATSNGYSLVKEIMKGDFIRSIDGNFIEEITGSYERRSEISNSVSSINSINADLNIKSVGINMEEVQTKPNVSTKIK